MFSSRWSFYCADWQRRGEGVVADCASGTAPLFRCFTSWDSNWSLNAVIVHREASEEGTYCSVIHEGRRDAIVMITLCVPRADYATAQMAIWSKGLCHLPPPSPPPLKMWAPVLSCLQSALMLPMVCCLSPLLWAGRLRRYCSGWADRHHRAVSRLRSMASDGAFPVSKSPFGETSLC